MKQKKNPRFRFSGSIDMEIIRRQVKRHRRSVLGQWTIRIVVAAMIVTGTYLVIENQTYTSVATADSHKKDTEDSNQYIAFSDGVIRYSRDGVVFLNKKNKEKWIQPCQIQNPIVDVNEDVFAIADVGGNTIMIFQKSGLKGEIETTLPIEKISVSNQGIVSAILKNESTPQIISYDAVGNILVEHQVNLNSTGYPISLDMSADGENLMVSYLSTKNGTLKSMVAFYNFGKEGQEKTDNLIYTEDFEQTVVPDVFYMDASTSVAVGDRSFVIYEGTKSVKKKTEVKLNQEIRSEFHSDRYIGFILTNKDKSGYEVQLYDKTIVSYQAKEGSKVKLFYKIKGSGKKTLGYHSEMLVPVFENLYVKQFVLYADEELDYYIQESDGKESTNTEKQIIRNDHAILAGRFGRINAMVQMTPANRNKAMMEYEEEDILAKKMFKLYE